MVDAFGVVLLVLHPIQQPMNVFVKTDTIKLVLIYLDEEYVKVSVNVYFMFCSHSLRYFFILVCPKPYHVVNSNGQCVWSCGEGTTPSTTTNECVCQRGYIQTGTDQWGRRVCKSRLTIGGK